MSITNSYTSKSILKTSDETGIEIKNLHIYPSPRQVRIEQIELNPKIRVLEDYTLKTASRPQNKASLSTINPLTNRFATRNTKFDTACMFTEKRSLIDFAGYYLTSHKYNLFSCLAMKTGSSSWFYTLWELQNPGTPPAETGFWSVMADQKKFVNSQQKSQVRKPRGESTFKRFLTTRHPLTRLYSGWHEHMRVVDGNPVGDQWKYFKLINRDAWGETHVCTWEKFVELFATGKYVINDHHHPVSKLCGGCDISWDFIVKQETMDEDSEFILRMVNAPENVHVGNKNQVSFVKKDPFSYLINYCRFSDEVIGKIEDYYAQDFLLYTYDKFSREQTCNDQNKSLH